jgi:phenylpropionate dioxygenase-like ring-hydroxylating dioxygenase large terminal subunit/DNA-binding transcriptional regulator YbjK
MPAAMDEDSNVSSAVKGSGIAAAGAPKRSSRARQRQRLIDACISAIHIHGPSSTTVEKVVAIAGMSPGIVRFYFDSKAAMMVASLQSLAAEFEEQVLVPVAARKDDPVRALELLVELYLGAEIASPRKVSVWYAFWGEANSRQEYYDICGHKDERFEALVRELIERMVAATRSAHLDADAIALGLIGVLEILWQGFAFQDEANIDRVAARRRGLNYLRSVFPGEFAAGRPVPTPRSRAVPAPRLPAWAYGNAALQARELERLFRGSWQFAGVEAELAQPGSFLTMQTGAEQALVLRGADGQLRALANRCAIHGHALLSVRRGRIGPHIRCPVHGLEYQHDGTPLGSPSRAGAAVPPLTPSTLATRAGLVLVGGAGEPFGSGEFGLLPSLLPGGATSEVAVAADWKHVAAVWLESALPEHPAGRLAEFFRAVRLRSDAETGRVSAQATIGSGGASFSARRYASLAASLGPCEWWRLFLPPNQLLELRPDGLTVLQVEPAGPGHSRVRTLHCRAAADGELRLMNYLARRLHRQWLSQDMEVAAAAQRERSDGRRTAPAPAALATLERRVKSLCEDLAGEKASPEV